VGRGVRDRENTRPALHFEGLADAQPILRGGAKLAGFIPNKPAHKMLQHSIEALRQGDRLLFFPEGTRTRKQEGV
jgi:1-acyl-sn-glycerol-3-phosphate acyltransferase